MDQLSGSHSQIVIAVADPGFSPDGCANSPGGGTYDFAKFSQKMHEIERIRSATVLDKQNIL